MIIFYTEKKTIFCESKQKDKDNSYISASDVYADKICMLPLTLTGQTKILNTIFWKQQETRQYRILKGV